MNDNKRISAAKRFYISDINKASKLLDALNNWANVIEAGSNKLTTVDIAGAPESLYTALREFQDIVANDVEGFIYTIRQFKLIEFDDELLYATHHVDVDKATEILRLFMHFLPDGTVWNFVYVYSSDQLEEGNFGAGIAEITKDYITATEIEDLHDQFKDLSSIDDRRDDDDSYDEDY